MLQSESPIFAEQYNVYIYFFNAYGCPVRLEIQNLFFGPKSSCVTKGLRVRNTHKPTFYVKIVTL